MCPVFRQRAAPVRQIQGRQRLRSRCGDARDTALILSRMPAWLSSTTGATSGYWDVVRTRFFSNSLASLTLVPVVVTWMQDGLAPP